MGRISEAWPALAALGAIFFGPEDRATKRCAEQTWLTDLKRSQGEKT
jgi:hypothetical protein